MTMTKARLTWMIKSQSATAAAPALSPPALDALLAPKVATTTRAFAPGCAIFAPKAQQLQASDQRKLLIVSVAPTRTLMRNRNPPCALAAPQAPSSFHHPPSPAPLLKQTARLAPQAAHHNSLQWAEQVKDALYAAGAHLRPGQDLPCAPVAPEERSPRIQAAKAAPLALPAPFPADLEIRIPEPGFAARTLNGTAGPARACLEVKHQNAAHRASRARCCCVTVGVVE